MRICRRRSASALSLPSLTFTGRPVPGATVTATQAEKKKASATTNADGIDHLAGLADGLWTFTIELFGFATITREIVRVPDYEVFGLPAWADSDRYADRPV